MTPLRNTPTLFMWNIPRGKPDPSQPLKDPHDDQRSRVEQKATKAGLSWLYAMNRAGRPRIGKESKDPRFTALRSFEKQLSDCRKALIPYYIINRLNKKMLYENLKIMAKINPLDSEIKKINDDKSTSSEIFKSYIIDFQTKEGKYIPLDLTDYVEKFVSIYPAFLTTEPSKEECEEFRCFVKEHSYQHLTGELKKLIETVWHQSIEATCKEFTDLLFMGDDDKDEQTQYMLTNGGVSNYFLLETAILRRACREYGFVPSKWDPKMPFNALVAEIKRHGPLLAIIDDDVKSYPKHHIIVGTKIEKKSNGDQPNNFVIMLDPAIGNKPDEEQKITLLPYSDFIKSIRDTWNNALHNMPKDKVGYLVYKEDFVGTVETEEAEPPKAAARKPHIPVVYASPADAAGAAAMAVMIRHSQLGAQG